jgi:general secretion pathway protein D
MNTFVRIIACAWIAAIGIATGAHSQQKAPTASTINIDFQDIELAQVIKMIAEQTGRNFLFDERVRGKVTVISPTPVTPEEAYQVFESILQVKGFTTVSGPGGVIKIIPSREAKEQAIRTVPGDVAVPNRDQYITRLLPLENVKADAIANTLRPLISQEANLIAYPPTNTLILTDTAANIRRIVTLVSEIDVETHREQVKVIPIQHADAATLSEQLQGIFSESGSTTAGLPAGIRAAVRRAAPQQPVPGVQPGSGSSGEPRFLTDERTNSLIVIASQAMIQQVEKVIALLDYQRTGTGRIHVYRLKNADAEQMAQTLANLAQGAASPARAPGVPGAAAGAAAAMAQLGSDVRITADTPTNSLIIQSSSEAFSALSEVIAALDTRRTQVMVEALIMEVDVTDGEAFGLDLLYQNKLNTRGSAISVGSDPSGVFPAPPASGNPTNVIGQTVETFTTAVIGKSITITGPTGSPIQVPVIQGLLTATRSDKDTNVISAPVILTADNEEAEIIVGQEIPVPTTRLQTESGTGTFQTSQNIARENVGVTLRVKPQISEGDTVRLDVFQQISELQSSSDELGPTTTNRQVENVVYVRDGETVMIGGILSEVQSSDEKKVPFLGDIPILGWAFKRTTEDIRKVNLFIVLTPHIVRDPERLNELTMERRERFRDAARDTLELSEREKEQRRAAIDAGVDLPVDSNPVRREIDRHARSYPVSKLPEMRTEHEEREQRRLQEIERLEAKETTGMYTVHLPRFTEAGLAVSALEKLIDAGFDGTVLSRTENGVLSHYVELGPFTSIEQARSVARELRSEHGLESTVVVNP